LVHGSRESLRSSAPQHRKSCGAFREHRTRRARSLLQLLQLQAGGIHEIKLGSRLFTSVNDVFERAAVLLGQSEQQVAASAHRIQTCGIELDRRAVVLELSRQRLERVVRSVVWILESSQGWVDPPQRGER